jgi:hypothetical protein
MKKTVLIASVAALGLAAPGFAQGNGFEDADTDLSGGLSLSEVQAIAPDVTEDGFAAYDHDGNGELSEAEYEAWKMARPDDGSGEVEETETDSPYRG